MSQTIHNHHMTELYPAQQALLSPWHDLPCELRDTVIDLLRADRRALKACSLTCRAWLPRARSHLFRTISIDRRDGEDAGAHLLQSPTIAAYVQDIEINGSKGLSLSSWTMTDRQEGIFNWPTLDAPQFPARHRPSTMETRLRDMARDPRVLAQVWLKQILPQDTRLLAKVTSLRISALPLGSSLTVPLQPHFQQIKVLSIDGCKALAFSDFTAFLRAFPLVESLHLLAIQWLPRSCGSSEPAGFPDSFPRIRFLELSHKVDAAPFLSWMIAEGAHTDLSSLHCAISGLKCASAVSQLFKAVGPTLRCLVIGFRETADIADVLRKSSLDLAHLTGLRSIRIQCSTISPTLRSTSSRPSLSWIVILLSTANSPQQLKELTISIYASDLSALNMEGLDVVLSHARYDGLERVVFEIDFQKHVVDKEQITSVGMRMTAVRLRGLLRFVPLGLPSL